MPPNSGSGQVARTWTDNQSAHHHKWTIVFWLALVFIALLSFFIWTRLPSTAERTFVTSIAIADYGQRLANPHYAVWDLEELGAHFEKKGLSPWHAVAADKHQSVDQLMTSLDRLEAALDRENMAARDTLIVQLRGHAIVTDAVPRLVLLAGESEQNEGSQVGKLPISELLVKLQQLPARNVIVLADICDLDFAPQFGLAINPVPTALQEVCGHLKAVDGRQLWVICAKAEFQTAHISHLRKRTLLQSACEFALDANANNSDGSRQTISLAEFYDRIVRYAHAASNQTQTPLLMRAGDSTHCLPNGRTRQAQSAWQSAQQVAIARVIGTTPADEDDGSKNPTALVKPDTSAGQLEDEEVKARRARATLRQVAAWHPQNASPSVQGEPAAPQSSLPKSNSSNSANPANTQSQRPSEEAPALEVPLTGKSPTAGGSSASGTELEESEAARLAPVLGYWRLRDELQSAQSVWSPHQFAPHVWRQHQQQFLQYQFRAYQEGKRAPMNDLIDELRALQVSMRGGASNSRYRLVRAYQAFKSDAAIRREPWEDNSILPKNEQARWNKLRDQYRAYADACAELPEWAMWTRRDLEHVELLSDLVDELVAAHRTLAFNQSALEQDSITNLDAAKISRAVRRLREGVALKHTQIKASLAKGKKAQLSWDDEHQLQKLLELPLIDASMRQEIWLAYRLLTEVNVKEPDRSSIQINRDELELLVVVPQSDSRLLSWFDILNKSVELVDAKPVQRPVTAEEMRQWGSSFSAAISQSSPRDSAAQTTQLHTWHVGCLQSLCLTPTTPLPDFLAGIVVPASLSRALVIELPGDQRLAFKDKEQIPLTISVKRKDGSDVDRCLVSWRFEDQAVLKSLKIAPADCLTISHSQSSSPQLLTSEPQLIGINNKTLRLTCTSNIESTDIKQPIRFELQVSEPGSGTERLKIEIDPRQPDVVELAAIQLMGRKRVAIASPGNAAPLVLRAIAMHKAKSKFEFELRNLSSEPKRCYANVYALPADAVSGGSNVKEALLDEVNRRRLRPVFVSDPVTLPPAAIAQASSVPITIKPSSDGAASPTPATPLTDEPRWLFFQIHELDAEDKPKSKPPYDASCALRGISPAIPEVLSIEPIPPVSGAGFQLVLKPSADSWTTFDYEELAVTIEATDDAGTPVDIGAVSHTFTKDQPRAFKADLLPNPAKPKPNNLIAHLSIGGYPRAIAYSAGDGEPQRYPSAFAWLKSVEAIAKDRTETFSPQDRNGQLVFPAKDKNQDLEYEGLLVKTQMDIPAHDRQAVVRLLSANGSEEVTLKRYDFDRQFHFQLEALGDGLLSVAATATDIQCRLNTGLNGLFRLQIQFVSSTNQADSVTAYTSNLLFDRQPPDKSVINPSARTLVEGKTLTLTMRPSDDQSGISRVAMAIDGPGAEEGVFDPGDSELLKGSLQANKEWDFVLDADALIKSRGESVRSVRIVAMSVDYAGNEQRAHPPLTVNYQPAPKPQTGSKQSNSSK